MSIGLAFLLVPLGRRRVTLLPLVWSGHTLFGRREMDMNSHGIGGKSTRENVWLVTMMGECSGKSLVGDDDELV